MSDAIKDILLKEVLLIIANIIWKTVLTIQVMITSYAIELDQNNGHWTIIPHPTIRPVDCHDPSFDSFGCLFIFGNAEHNPAEKRPRSPNLTVYKTTVLYFLCRCG